MTSRKPIGPITPDNQPHRRPDPDDDEPTTPATTAPPAATGPATPTPPAADPAAPATAPPGELERNGLAVPDRQPAVSRGVPFSTPTGDPSSKEGRKGGTDNGDSTSIPLGALVRRRPDWRTDYVKDNLDLHRVVSEWLRMRSITTGRSKKMLVGDILLAAIPDAELDALINNLY